MARRFGWFLLVALVSTGVAAEEEGKPTAWVAGRVVDPAGRPVAGASVWSVSPLREELAKGRTDADGRFRLGPIPWRERVDVWFEGEGFARGRVEGVAAFEGAGQDLGTLTLLPGVRVIGRVVDVDGRAIPGAKVGIQVYRRVFGHTIASNQSLWALTSDAEGRFRSPPLPPGEGDLMMGTPGKVRNQIDRRLVPGTPEVDLGEVRLEDELPILGVVVDRDGQPAPKVEVVADYDYENPATTGPDGRFTLGGAGREVKQLRLTSNDYFAPDTFPIGPDRRALRLVVSKAYEIHGNAVDAETGAPVKLDSVRLCTVVHLPDGTTSLQG